MSQHNQQKIDDHRWKLLNDALKFNNVIDLNVHLYNLNDSDIKELWEIARVQALNRGLISDTNDKLFKVVFRKATKGNSARDAYVEDILRCLKNMDTNNSLNENISLSDGEAQVKKPRLNTSILESDVGDGWSDEEEELEIDTINSQKASKSKSKNSLGNNNINVEPNSMANLMKSMSDLEDSLKDVTAHMNNKFNSLSKGVLELKNVMLVQVQKNTAAVEENTKKIQQMNDKTENTIEELRKEFRKELVEIKTTLKEKRPNQYSNNNNSNNNNYARTFVRGEGENIGIKTRFHIALSRIPKNESTEKIKKSLEEKFAGSGTIISVEELKPMTPNPNAISKTFKVVIEAKSVNEVYNPKCFPEGSMVRRYRFPRRTEGQTSSANQEEVNGNTK